MSIPKNWIEITLNDIGKWGSGGTPKRTNPAYYGGDIPWLIIGDINDGYVNEAKTFITEEGLKNSSAKLVPSNTLLIAMYGSIGKLGITQMECATNQAIAYCHTNDSLVSKKFVFYYLLSMRQTLLGEGKGGAQQNISQTVLKAFSFPLPPLNEQKRIAKKLDELLATVESIKTRLDNAPTIIKRFRQSILAAATSGKLTEEWRGENGITEEWGELTVDDIAKVGTGNTPLKSNTSFYENGDIPWLTSSVTGSPYVKEADKFVTQTAIDECKLKLYNSGTLLVAMYGEGKTRGQVTELTFPASINQACAAVMIDEDKIEKSYLKMRLQENYAEIRMLAEGGNQPNLNLSKVRSITVPTPSREEQKEIVSQVESLFTLADTLEEKIEAAKKRVDRLTQSILAKAFRGELVEQDPNDESAEVLLERIKNEG